MTPSGPRGPAAGPALVGVAAIATLATAMRAAKPVLNGPDPFWHWDLGRRMVSDGLLHADPYSFLTQGQEWILNQWGTEALVGLVDRVGGLWLMAVFAALLVGGAYLHVGWQMWRRSPSLLTVGVLGLVYMAGMGTLALRGNLLTFVLLPLMLREAQRADEPRLRVVVPLMVLWANVHAAFLLGVAVLVIHGAGEVVRASRTDRLRILRSRGGIALAALAMTAVTPYGPGLLLQVLQLSARGGQSGISEWRPPVLLSTDVLPFTVLVALVVTAVAVAAREDDLPDILLVVGFTLLGTTTARNVAPAAIVLGIVGAPYVYRASRQLRQLPSGLEPGRLRSFDRSVAGVLLVLGVTFALLVPPRTSAVGAHVENMPLATIGALNDTDRPARVVTTTFWSPAVAILTNDDVRTAVDGRLELFDGETIQQWNLVNSADPGWEDQLDNWCATDTIVPADSPLGQTLSDTEEWQHMGSDRVLGAREQEATWFRRSSTPTVRAPCP